MTHKILIVDDMPENLEAIVNIVERSNQDYEILQALNGQVAEFIAKEELPDLVITDWEMPVKDGIELIKALQAHEPTREIPVIMCTGIMTTSENLQMALEAGAVDFIRKPVDHIELSARVRSMLTLRDTLKRLRKTQNKLVQSEKLASVGRVTAGIAHEILNPLNFVNNFARLSGMIMDNIKEDVMEPDATSLSAQEIVELRENLNDLLVNLEKIGHHGDRAANIVKMMLKHSGPAGTEPVPVKLNEFIQQYLTLSYQGKRESLDLFECEIEEQYDPLIQDVSLLQQEIGLVLLNLFNNAFDAMHEKKSTLGEQYSAILIVSTLKRGDGVLITVRDNGPGIEEQNLEEIFVPFFTTKPTGKGMGLGLSLSYEMVQAQGGEMKVQSKHGDWTEFSVFLPNEKK